MKLLRGIASAKFGLVLPNPVKNPGKAGVQIDFRPPGEFMQGFAVVGPINATSPLRGSFATVISVERDDIFRMHSVASHREIALAAHRQD
jgi:hypothetical protein